MLKNYNMNFFLNSNGMIHIVELIKSQCWFQYNGHIKNCDFFHSIAYSKKN